MTRRIRLAEARGAVWAARLLVSRGWIDWALLPRTSAPPSASLVEALAARVNLVMQAQSGGNGCLVRAVAVALLLNRRRYPIQVRVGCRSNSGGMEAHAWIEVDGRVIVGDLPDLETFVPIHR